MKQQPNTIERKKMYKKGRNWVIASTIALAIGGGLTLCQTETAHAATGNLTVGTVTLSDPDQASTSDAAQSTAAAASQTSAASTAAQASAANSAAETAAAPASSAATTANPATETVAQWQAKEDAYQAASSAAKTQIAASSAATSQAKADYASQVAQQAQTQAQSDAATVAQKQQANADSLAAVQAQQASAYAASSAATAQQVSALNAQRTTAAAAQVGDGDTFAYAVQNNQFTNIVSKGDAKIIGASGWNGNYIIGHLPALTDDEVKVGSTFDMDKTLYFFDEGFDSNQPAATWAFNDKIEGNALTDAQQTELNQYVLYLLNNYRKDLGLPTMQTSQSFLSKEQNHASQTVNNGITHDSNNLNQTVKGWTGECLSYVNKDAGNHRGGTTDMLELFQSVADSFNSLLSYDQDANNGHRNILLSSFNTQAAASLHYSPVVNKWVLNIVTTSATPTDNINANLKTFATTKDNNAEIDAKVKTLQDALSAFKTQQAADYQAAADDANAAVSLLKGALAAQEKQAQQQNTAKVTAYNQQQDAALAQFTKDLNAKVAALDPGAKPVVTTPTDTTDNSGTSTTKPADTTDNSGTSTTKPADTTDNGGTSTTKPADTTDNSGNTTTPTDTADNSGTSTTKPADTTDNGDASTTTPADTTDHNGTSTTAPTDTTDKNDTSTTTPADTTDHSGTSTTKPANTANTSGTSTTTTNTDNNGGQDITAPTDTNASNSTDTATTDLKHTGATALTQSSTANKHTDSVSDAATQLNASEGRIATKAAQPSAVTTTVAKMTVATAVTKTPVATTAAVTTPTQSVTKTSQTTLPQTGENTDTLGAGLGVALLALLGLSGFVSRKREF